MTRVLVNDNLQQPLCNRCCSNMIAFCVFERKKLWGGAVMLDKTANAAL